MANRVKIKRTCSEAIRIGRGFAKTEQRPFSAVFDDTLSGDLARFRVMRELHRAGHDARVIELVIEGVLTP